MYFLPEVDLNLKVLNDNELLPLFILQCFDGEENVTEYFWVCAKG